MEHRTNVQLTAAVPLSGNTKESIIARASKALERFHFRNALMHIYVKNANSHIGCTANLFTDEGRYHAYAEDWNVRSAVADAIAALNSQVVRHTERRLIRL